MAALTWRNVDGPNFSGANDMWKTAAALMNSGFDRARQGLGDFQNITTDQQSAQLMQQVTAAGNDPAAIAAVTAKANPAYLSPAALQFANNQAGVLLDREGKQIDNAGNTIQNTIKNQNVRANDYNFDRTQIDNQRADTKYAMMPEAISAMTGLRAKIANGQLTPEQAAVEEQSFLGKYGQTLGVTDPNQVSNFMSGSLQAQSDQQNANKNNLAYAAGLDDTIKRQDAKGIAANALGMVGNDPDQAIRAIQNFGNVNPETKIAALAEVETLRAAFPKKSAADSIIEGGSLYGDVNRPSITLPDNYQPVIMQNNGKRNLPLNSNLNKALYTVLPNLGLTAVVTSGGQVTQKEADAGLGERTGSTRHDHGAAADIQFKDLNGKILSWENPQDIPVLQSAVRGLKEVGLTGFGAAKDYMGDTTTHVGYGEPATWGSEDGKPYQALLDAYNGATTKADQNGPVVNKAAATAAIPQYQAAMDAISNNQSYVAPIDSNKVQVIGSDGTASTEKTFTTEIGGAFFNIPTIVNGKELPEETALKEFYAGTNPAVGVFQNKKEANDAAENRSNEISKSLEAAVTEKDANATNITQQTNANLSTALSTPIVNNTNQTPIPDGALGKLSQKTVSDDRSQEIKIDEQTSIPAVDANRSKATQDLQGVQRSSAINGALEKIKTKLAVSDGAAPASSFLGSTWDYFMEDPNVAEDNATAREGAKKALEFYQEDNVKNYFQENPSALVQANKDPIKFADSFDKGILEKAKNVAVGEPVKENKDAPQQITSEQVVASRTRELNAAESVEQAFAAVKSTRAIDAANDQYPALRVAIAEADQNKESPADAANRLTGKDGKLSAYTHQEVTTAIQQIRDELGVRPSVAAALLEEKGNYDVGYLGGYLLGFGSGYELNMDEIKDLYSTYQTGANAKSGVSNMVNAQMSQYQAAQVTSLEKEVAQTQEALQLALVDPNTPPEKAMDYERRLSELPDIVKSRLANILAAGNTDANIRKRTSN